MVWIWLIIVVVVIFLLIAFKFKEVRHKFGLVAISIIIIFLLLSVTSIYKTNKDDLKTFDGVSKVLKLYFSWLGNLFKNTGKVTTFAIHQDWGLNMTNNTGK